MKNQAVNIPVVSCTDCKFYHLTGNASVSYCERIKMHQEVVNKRTCMVKVLKP